MDCDNYRDGNCFGDAILAMIEGSEIVWGSSIVEGYEMAGGSPMVGESSKVKEPWVVFRSF